MKLDLIIKKISDLVVRENFQKIIDFFDEERLLDAHWGFFQLEVNRNVTSAQFRHNLGFIPKDLIQTSLVGTGAITWLYNEFDKDFLYYTTSGTDTADPLIVRGFIGAFNG